MSHHLAFATMVLLVSGVHADDKPAAPKALQGTWKLTSAELAGKPLGGDFTKSTTLTIEGDRYTVMVGTLLDKGTLKIDAGKTPKAIDIVGVEGANKGKTILAIYEINGDTVRICYDLSGAARPTEFKTKPDTKLFLATYKRDK